MTHGTGAGDNGPMTEEPRAWKARTRGSEAEVDGALRPSTVTIHGEQAHRVMRLRLEVRAYSYGKLSAIAKPGGPWPQRICSSKTIASLAA